MLLSSTFQFCFVHCSCPPTQIYFHSLSFPIPAVSTLQSFLLHDVECIYFPFLHPSHSLFRSIILPHYCFFLTCSPSIPTSSTLVHFCFITLLLSASTFLWAALTRLQRPPFDPTRILINPLRVGDLFCYFPQTNDKLFHSWGQN